jgi:VWFA-related protein
MKKLLFVFIIFWYGYGLAGPFIKIHSIDTTSDFPRVSLLVSARDTDGNWLSGLSEEHIMIYEDGYRVNYVQVESQPESMDTLYLVFSMDSSKSISEESFDQLKRSAVDIITAAGDKEEIALCRFNDKVVVLKNFSKDKSALINEVKNITRHGTKTMLYNAVYDSIELVSRTDSGRKAIVIFTDGKDEGSSVTLDDVISSSLNKGVPLYVISLSNSEFLMNMKRMSKLTGGNTILIDSVDNLVLAYKHIIQNIKKQHLVKYVSMAQQDGMNHQLEVRLKYNHIRDRDIRSFSVEKEFLTIEVPDYKQILLIIMIILFVILISSGIVLLIKKMPYSQKKKKKIIEKVKREEPNFDDEFVEAKPVQNFGSSLFTKNDVFDDDEDEAEKKYFEYYSHAWLILQINGQRKKFPLSKDEMIIGTSYDAHLMVKNAEVSPRHCSVKFIDGTYYLFDLVSQTGTYLNGKKLLRPRQLFDWDEITIGPVSFIFRGSTV